MMETIGQTAGQIWNYLNENGETSVAKMKKELDLKGNFAELGLGWLAREGKVEMSKKGTTTNVRLV
ncbi:TPA: winged helix-turn-helix domain-containing protein [Candidatus Avigastranaerophilus faecigallinarum]|nr:winged helix-turn-helix domain-containing protein [Candidatus Avigastranaerophilus faecigallinarum]